MIGSTVEGIYATGRRKTARAKVWIFPGGTGRIIVNGKDYREYFPRILYQKEILQPFEVTNTVGQFDVKAKIEGGGPTGQAEALRHGIARALEKYNPDFRKPLKKTGLLRRDPRMVERKKYGYKKARRSPQYSKR